MDKKTIFVAYIIDNDFEKQILMESTDLHWIKNWIELNSKDIDQPIILDWYYY